VICWINGSFGAGKTLLAGELRHRCPDALLFDPEEVGFMLRDAAPSGEFQDLPRMAAAGGGGGPGAG
jgi:hypothetical protein